jgi:hypothetical protein
MYVSTEVPHEYTVCPVVVIRILLLSDGSEKSKTRIAVALGAHPCLASDLDLAARDLPSGKPSAERDAWEEALSDDCEVFTSQ